MQSTVPTISTTVTPKVCEDVMTLTKEEFNSLVAGPVETSPVAIEDNGKGLSLAFENAKDEIVITVPFPIGATLELLEIVGTYDYYFVEVEEENEAPRTVQNVNGDTAFDQGSEDRNTFDEEIKEGGAVIITIRGPASGFGANVTEFRVCIEELEFCRLTNDHVFDTLKFLPVDNILGVITPGNVTIVKYGDSAPTIESGVTITGYCYVCVCEGRTLTCEVQDCEVCPEYEIECVGNCTDAMTVITYEHPGVPYHCKVDEIDCTPEDCTTPTECPTPWESWSPCDQKCQRHRERSCENCHVSCKDNHTLVETEKCDVCVTTITPISTTEPRCSENEVYDCVSPYEECMEECSVFRMEAACNNLDNSSDSCTDHCRCKDGFRRNMFGQCVEKYECECYNGTYTTPIPMNYVVNVSECVYCECTAIGYDCQERDDCCELKEWVDWSECSTTCGQGIRTRTRKSRGLACEPEDTFEEQTCEIGECPCILDDGTEWESGKEVADECKVCTCLNGYYSCEIKEEEVPPWDDEKCEKKCYCNENGTKTCVEDEDLDRCKEIRERCNQDNNTLVDDPNDRCCPKCMTVHKPCDKAVVEQTRLNFTGSSGRCVSDLLPVHSCVGSCGVSEDSTASTDYNSSLGQFDLVMQSDCKCCRAKTVTKEVEFDCEDLSAPIKINVKVVDSCSCTACE